jgi:hypothetical protein
MRSDVFGSRRIGGFFSLFFGCFLVTGVGVESICLNVRMAGTTAHYPIGMGDKLYIVFSHSIYGSQVEEHFRATSEGFQLFELRYAEPRLVEFYGHDWAVNKDGWWVVRKRGSLLTILDLHVSPDSWIAVLFGTEKLTIKHDSVSDGRARLALSACPHSNND